MARLISSNAGDGIFQLWGSIPCMLMHWLLKSPEHQQVWYWLCRTDNMYCCSRVNFIYVGEKESKILFKMSIYLLQSSKQFSMSQVDNRFWWAIIYQTKFPLQKVQNLIGTLWHQLQWTLNRGQVTDLHHICKFYNTIQYNTIQCSTMQYNTTPESYILEINVLQDSHQ